MQDILVYLVVAGAALYLGRMLWGFVSGKKSGCSGCSSNCGAPGKVAAPTPALLQIEVKNLNGNKP